MGYYYSSFRSYSGLVNQIFKAIIISFMKIQLTTALSLTVCVCVYSPPLPLSLGDNQYAANVG